jgi:hypothetical protein
MFLLNPGNKAQIDQNPYITTIDRAIDTTILIRYLKRAT